MRKRLISALVLSTILLTSCGNENNIDNIDKKIEFYEKGEGDFFEDYSYIKETYSLISKTKMIKLGDKSNYDFNQNLKNFELSHLTNRTDEDGNILYGQEVKKIIQERIIDELKSYKKEKCLIELKEQEFMRKLLKTEGLDFDKDGNKYGYDADELYMKGLIEEFVKRHKKTINKSDCEKYINKLPGEINNIEELRIFNNN